MDIPVLIQPVPGKGFVARAGSPFDWTAEGATADEALANLQAEADAMRADAIVEGRVADAEEIADAEEEAGIPAAEAEAGLHAGAAGSAAAAAVAEPGQDAAEDAPTA